MTGTITASAFDITTIATIAAAASTIYPLLYVIYKLLHKLSVNNPRCMGFPKHDILHVYASFKERVATHLTWLIEKGAEKTL